MTRSKQKKELEEQLAYSEVLRNGKVIQNTLIEPNPTKSKPNDKTPPLRITRSVEQRSSEEKGKPQISTRSSKNEKIQDSKQKL
ncbi:unnamed protein product [Hermetia illucens]|uniref:Uncharacterized protein n=1 Tax=Hermetia illucens TaxID=343691 RepID=A0A7R8UGL4_HERIL|nr:unnamed protein product [Hermetia illucens]